MNAFALMATLGLDSSEYEKGLDKSKNAGSALSKGLATAAKAGIAAIGAATTAVVGFGATAVKTGEGFDKSMSQVAATMGKTMDEMQNEVGSVTLTLNGQTKEFTGTLREFAQEMGKNTAFSATQAADALNYMALAGYDTQTSMNMLPNVLNLAAAGDMELARASDMVTDTQTAFGISLERTSQMVDEMAKAASTGNTSVEQLGDAFLTVGGLAQELNGGMVTLADGTQKPVDGVQELEIALTAMANAGVKGSEAGTHMRNMLLKLSDPTDDGVAQMKALGVSVFDAGGQMRSLKDIMGDLNGALGNLTQEEKIQAISDLFNTRDMASAEALLGAVGQDWDKIGESILNAEGAAQKMADTQLDNLAGDVTLFKSALEGAQIAVSDVLSPALREFVQFGTDGLSQLTSAFQEGGLTGAMKTFGQVLSDGLNMLISKLPSFVDAGMQLLGALGQGLLDNLPTITNAAGEILMALLDGIVKALPKLAEGAVQVISQLATFLGEQLPTLIPAIIDMILGIVDAIIDNVDLLIDGAIALILGLAEGLIDALPKLIEKIPEIIGKIVEALINNLPKLIEGVIQLVVMLVTHLPEIIMALIKAIPQIIASILKAFGPIGEGLINLFSAAWDGIKNVFSSVGSWFSEKFSDAKEKASKAWEGVKENMARNWEQSKEIFANIGSWFSEKFSDARDKASEAWSKVKDNMANNWEQSKQIFANIGGWFKDKFTQAKENSISAWSNVKEKMSGIWDKIKSAFKFGDALQWGKDMIQNFIDGIKAMIGKVKETVSNVAKTVKDFLGFSEPDKGPLSNFHTFAPDMIDLFIQGIKDNTSKLQDQIAESFDFGSSVVGEGSDMATSSGISASGTIESILLKYLPDLANMQVVLSTGELVGATAGAYDTEFGSIASRGSRR